MSERMGFTSNYIYDIEDYKKLRKKFEEYGNSKWMCLAPEAKWGEDEVMPLIQGRLGDIVSLFSIGAYGKYWKVWRQILW